MIVEIDEKYLEEDENIVDHVRLIVRILECYHYLKYDASLFERMVAMMKKYAGKRGCELFEESLESLTIPDRIRDNVTTLLLSELNEVEINVLLFKPSELLIENSANEWPVYERIIKTFQKDATYGSVIKYINRRKGCFHLVPANAGGKHAIPAIVDLKNNGEYQNLYNKKVCVIFDRDSENGHSFSRDNNRLFAFFAGDGKNADNITEDEIYKLDFGNQYIWHMWYKRAIENYFPADKYAEQGMDTSVLPEDREEYDYYQFKEPNPLTPHCYRKSMMKEMGRGMNLNYYQTMTKIFNVDGGVYNEMLLLMLKIAKIV